MIPVCPAPIHHRDTILSERALGAPMVSSEGVCAAYYAYRRRVPETVA
jgi:hydrogenase maturation factor